jgi:hypothetical protein
MILQGETEHKIVKTLYSRASKANAAKSIAEHQGHGRALQMAQCNKAVSENLNLDDQRPRKHRKVQKDPLLLFEDEDMLPFVNPDDRYHIAGDKKMKLNVYQWPDKELLDRDVAYKVYHAPVVCSIID